MKYRATSQVHVSLDTGATPKKVGRLAWIDRKLYFEYDIEFLRGGLKLSPFKLPLRATTYCGEPLPFEGLFGLFNDSLPDGWGRLLLDRKLRSYGIAPEMLGPLDRLTHVGKFGMGALVYEPDESDSTLNSNTLDLNKLATETTRVLAGETEVVFPELLNLSGSSGGARPKVMVGLSIDKSRIIHGQQLLPKEYEHWMIKFPSSHDFTDAGAVEYAYSLMARAAGLEMMATHLFPAKKGPGYFGVERFDRFRNTRLHMHSLSGLIHSDHQLPSLDYRDVLKVTFDLTRSMKEVTKLFRITSFNVLARNRDDHAKNFSFLMDANGSWRVSPAYDLTYSAGPGGEHCTTVMGEGKSPTRDHLERLAEQFGISKGITKKILEHTREAISEWPKFAEEAGVRKATIRSIKKSIQSP